MAARLGVTVEELYGRHERFLTDPPERIDWDDYVALKDITEKIAGSDERLIECGAAIADTPGMLMRGLSLFLDPGSLLTTAVRAGWGRMYTNLQVDSGWDGDRVRVRIALLDGYAPCRAFFVQNAGILANLPRKLGCGLAEVEWETDGKSAVYFVKPPPSRTLWARAGRWLRVALNSSAAVDELMAQQAELNEQNRALQAALVEVRAALATRERFLQTIDHELRTPLNGIRGGIEAMSHVDDPELRRWVDAAARSEHRLSHVIGAVLEYTHLDTGVLDVRPRDFRPAWLADVLVAEARRRGDVVVHLDGPESELWLRADDERIRRVADELIDNAVRFASDGPLEVALTHEDGHLELAVSDAGPGVPVADRARIFEPFVQLGDGAARRHEGSGLGLAIAGSIARALDGSIEVGESAAGGARFVARFPVETAQRAARSPRAAARRVLVVDDDAVNRMVGRRLLKQLGCDVVLAEDGVDALEKLDADRADLVLMDCEMPRLDGWSATRRLRASEAQYRTPVVAVTAYTSDEDRRRCYDAGMDDFVPKPLSREILDAVLERWT
jgi:signal transduction histidine kinase